MKIEKKTPSNPRKRDTKTAKAVPCNCYKREDIEGILLNVMITALCVAALVLTVSLLVTAIKH